MTRGLHLIYITSANQIDLKHIRPYNLILHSIYQPVLYMSESSHLTFLQVEQESQNQSFKLRLNFAEKNWQRAKDENGRLQQKLSKMQKQTFNWQNQRKRLVDKIDQLQRVISKHDLQKESWQKKMQIRTQRHQAEQNNYTSRGEKQLIQRKIKRSQAELQASKDEQQQLTRRNNDIQLQLSQQRQHNQALLVQIDSLQKQHLDELSRMEEIEIAYNEKIALLEAENVNLKKQMDSLIIQVKLFERKHQIQGLLAYQENIGGEGLFRYSKGKPTARTLDFDSQNINPNYSCCCSELQLQIIQKDELIALLKQKSIRASNESEALRKRCSTLQSIICGSSI